ncbi:MAG: xylulokinase [Ruminococcaceae bacterium]|nr:xylulokinase [Oscillospiraceae bacterium]
MSFFIGIDLGTSAVKMLLINESGEILKTVSKEYPLYFPKPNWSEQNPEDWWKAVCEGLEQLTDGLNKADIKGIGVGGQMHGLVMLDENGSVIRPAILWNDTRTGKQTDYLNNVIGKERLQQLTGNIAFAGFTAPKILWVKENEPEAFKQCRKICLPKDYINYKLTGVFATDVSDASGTLYFDVKNRKWSEEMLGIIGIDVSFLPKVFESYEVIGKTELFGLDCPVIAGAGDNAAAAVGTNTLSEGLCNISLGTSGTVFVPTDNFVFTKNPALHSFCHANGKYHLMGCILSAASCNKWLNETVFEAEYNVGGDDLGAPQTELYFLPYLSGERCPHNDPYVKGAFIGLTHATKREDMQRSVFEGVSFAIKDCISLCQNNIKTATVCGGGTKSKALMQILSDILNIELSVIDNEGPAFGGALLAAGIKKTPLIKYTVSPDRALNEIYEKKYKKYKTLYPALKDFYKED